MADLLQYLITTSPAHTHYDLPSLQLMSELNPETETFSTPRESPVRSMAPELNATSQAEADTGGDELPIFDIDDPRMQDLLASVPLSIKAGKNLDNNTTASTKPVQLGKTAKPVQLGKTHSPAHVIEFYKLCQERAITPVFTFDGVADKAEFSVLVEFGGTVLREDGPFTSKKEAKEVMAEKGISVVKELSVPEKIVKEGENWVGMLSGAFSYS